MSELHFSNNGRYFFSYFKRGNKREKNREISEAEISLAKKRYEMNRFTNVPFEDFVAPPITVDGVAIPGVSKKVSEKSLSNLVRGFVTKGISPATRRKIEVRARVLGFISEDKRVKNNAGNFITHRISWITLTLPSEQIHEDAEITKKCLSPFLDLCRKSGFLSNYLWKAEKQKNGNIHYHIMTDSFVSKNFLYRIWLLSVNKLGYVDRYHDRFAKMDLHTYKRQSFNIGVPDSVIMKRFWKGNRNSWQAPPCLDMDNVSDLGGIQKYIAKYVSKEDKDSSNIVTGRTWGCSQALNTATEYFRKDRDFNQFAFEASLFILKKKVLEFDFFRMIKITISSFFAWFPECAKEVLGRLRSLSPPCLYHNTTVILS